MLYNANGIGQVAVTQAKKSIASSRACRQVCDSHTGFAGIQQTYGGNKTTFTVRDYENSCY